MAQRILVIEDEPTLSRLLSYNLAQEGYAVDTANDGAEGLRAAGEEPYDLIVLDLMLPGMDGYEVLTRLREQGSRTPVIILTARNEESDVVKGLKLGADDYMTKPFGVAELLARVSAVLRRAGAAGGGAADADDGDSSKAKGIAVGGLEIFPDRYEVSAGGETFELRPKEFEVLLYLAQRPGTVVTRNDLMNAVWGFDYVGGERTVDVHVSSLRKKLEMNQRDVRIDSVRGVGYKLTAVKKG